MSLRRVLGGLGRFLVGAGVLILLFAAYQLFGTNLSAASSQRALLHQFAHERADPSTVAVGSSAAVGPPAPPNGTAVGVIKIPKIGVDKAVVQGVGESDLRQGPGHYPSTPMPGQPGNAAIAGHRTTYGAPFYRLNELVRGDTIYVTTRQGSFQYRVQRSFVVDPSDTSVIAPTKANMLTLTTCTPRFSAAQRLVVQSLLVGPAAAPSAVPVAASAGGRAGNAAVSANLAGGQGTWLPALLWGLALVEVGLMVWLLARLVRRRSEAQRWLVYLAGTPVWLFVLFLFFGSVSVLLPASI